MISSHTTSRELSERLKALKVPQTSYFWWAEYRHGHNQPEWEWRITESTLEGDYDHYRNECSAYLASELGQFFGKISAEDFIKAYGECFNFKGTAVIGTLGIMNLTRYPDMLGLMLEYLAKEGLIKFN